MQAMRRPPLVLAALGAALRAARADPKRTHSISWTVRGGATKADDLISALNPDLLKVERTTSPKPKPAKETLVFGKTFTDHMMEIDWDSESGWHAPSIHPFRDLSLSPAASSLHYALECFEGMKVYKDVAGEVMFFRPELNFARLNRSLRRLRMPEVEPAAFMVLLERLVEADRDWIPDGDGYALYLRPTAISTYPYLGVAPTEAVKLYVIMSPVGPYYPEGFKPIRLLADTVNARAWPGSIGWAKAGANYASTILPAVEAQRNHGCQQVLWLYSDKHYATEVGAMNIFFLLEKPDGSGKELVTCPLTRGDILPGVTRQSVLDLAREWDECEVSERDIGLPEIKQAADEGRLLEVFGTGTAAVVAPVRAISYLGQDIVVPTGAEIGQLADRVWNTLTDIQYGRVAGHPWAVRASFSRQRPD